jgi:hypothetical protein
VRCLTSTALIFLPLLLKIFAPGFHFHITVRDNVTNFCLSCQTRRSSSKRAFPRQFFNKGAFFSCSRNYEDLSLFHLAGFLPGEAA